MLDFLFFFEDRGEHLFEHGEGFVFVLLHYFSFAGTFVVYAAEMQHAVDDHSHQFVAVGCGLQNCVRRDGVERDEYVSSEEFSSAVVESDYVGVVVVVQEFYVYFQDFFIVAEDVG